MVHAIDAPSCSITHLSFIYDAKARCFSYVSYSFLFQRRDAPLARYFQERIEPIILARCPRWTRPKEGRCEIQSRTISRSFSYVAAPWWERFHPHGALLPPVIEVEFEENIDEPERSSLNVRQRDPNFRRVASLYRALSGMEGMSMEKVKDVAGRIEVILSHKADSPDALVRAIRVAAELQRSDR